MKAMILAAGMGTRLQQLTANTPKALVRVLGKPMIQWCIEHLIRHGFNDIIVNVHHHGQQIIDFLKTTDLDANISISDERDCLLDTAGGIKKAEWFLNDGNPFLVHNADVISNVDLTAMMAFHQKKKSLATLAVRNRSTSRYFLFDSENKLCGWKNEKNGELNVVQNIEASNLNKLAFSGIQMLSPQIFSLIEPSIPISTTKIYVEAAKQFSIYGFVHDNDYWFDLGKPENIQTAEDFLKDI
jgi:NDP-sugar pyrophosphorylase family protein